MRLKPTLLLLLALLLVTGTPPTGLLVAEGCHMGSDAARMTTDHHSHGSLHHAMAGSDIDIMANTACQMDHIGILTTVPEFSRVEVVVGLLSKIDISATVHKNLLQAWQSDPPGLLPEPIYIQFGHLLI